MSTITEETPPAEDTPSLLESKFIVTVTVLSVLFYAALGVLLVLYL